MLPYFSAIVPEIFCCLRISAFNLSSNCLLASLITSYLKSSPVNDLLKTPSHPPSTLSIVLLLPTGVTLTLRPHRQRSPVRVQVFHSIPAVC